MLRSARVWLLLLAIAATVSVAVYAAGKTYEKIRGKTEEIMAAIHANKPLPPPPPPPILPIPKELKRIAQSFTGRSVKIAAERVGLDPLTPVSMTQIAANQFLIANYTNIYLLDLDANTAKIIKPVSLPPVWNPTAVYFSPYYDRAFIANYTGNDILIAKIDGDRLTIEDHMQHPTTIGPEGVLVTPGGRYLVSSNYLGNSVSLFERVDASWQFRWNTPLTAAHGATIVEDAVYAGGESLIAKFDLTTGKEKGRIAEVDGIPIGFATCVNHDEQSGGIIVADTIGGRIYTLDRDLNPIAVMGSNGPTLANLSMPYCAYRDRNTTWILSTFQERFIRIAEGVVTSFEMRENNHPYLLPHTFSPQAWSQDRPAVSMLGKSFRPAYGAVRSTDGLTLVLPNMSSSSARAWPNYLTSIATSGDWVLISSVSSPVALLHNRTTGALQYSVHGEFDCWSAEHVLQCPSRRYPLTELVARATPATPTNAKPVGSYVPLLDYWSDHVTKPF
jgi:hypothetical protein